MTVRAKSLVTISLTASLVSCATLPVFASDNKTDDEKITIRVAWWGNQTRVVHLTMIFTQCALV